MIKNNFVFLKEFLGEFEATGAICPTSKWAAKALINPLIGSRSGKRILEAGAGTGAVTARILDRLRDDDELVICELNPRLMKTLKQNLAKNDLFWKHKDRIFLFEGAVQDLPYTGPFDVIVCAIPFLNLDIEIVASIFAKFKEISSADTVMTYYEYIGLRRIGKAVSPERRRRLVKLESFLKDMRNRCDVQKENVWLNLLPIHVYRIEGMADAA